MLPGTSLSFMKITFFVDGKKAFSKTGKILFTHFGLSGPLILNSSSQVSDLLYAGAVTATIDAYPDTDLGALIKKALGDGRANSGGASSDNNAFTNQSSQLISPFKSRSPLAPDQTSAIHVVPCDLRALLQLQVLLLS